VAVAWDFGGARVAKFTLARFTGAALIRDLLSLERHLQAGGVCAISLDHDKTFGAWAATRPTTGDTTVILPGGNQFTAFSSSGTIAAGDQISIESPNPEYLVDYDEVTTYAANVVTLTDGIRTSYQESPVFVRYRDFYPVLRLPAGSVGRPLMTHDHRRNWTWDSPLVESPGDIAALQTQAGALGGASQIPGAGISLEAAVGRQAGGWRDALRSAGRVGPWGT
jgi:hypothetical protein